MSDFTVWLPFKVTNMQTPEAATAWLTNELQASLPPWSTDPRYSATVMNNTDTQQTAPFIVIIP